jgi:hypothetical protein
LHEYVVLDAIDRERDFETRKAFFEEEQKRADKRAGIIAAMTLNAQRTDKGDKVWSYADFFPYLDRKEGDDATDREMSTAQTVQYLTQGFGLFVPTAFRQRVGLPD